MADITHHRVGELLRVVFEILWSYPAGLPAKDIFSRIPNTIQLTEYERGYPASTPNTPRFETIIRLTTNPLVKVGWLFKNNKGRWFITSDGRQACNQFVDAGEFYKESTRLYAEYFERKRGIPTAHLILEEAKEKSWEQVQGYILGLRPFELKILVGDLLRALGYSVIWVMPHEKDGGIIDMIATSDALGISRPRLVVQVKHKGQTTTAEGLRAFLSVLNLNDIGLFISSGGFTDEAEEMVSVQKDRTLALINLENLFDLWVKHYDKIAPEGRLRLPLEPVHFLSLPD